MTGKRDRPLEDRFWDKVQKGAPNECWNWNAPKTKAGYGRITTGASYPTRKEVYAHRLSYELRHGAICPGLEIDHLCHNRACVNPDHLRAATHAENGQNRKGPQPKTTSGHRGVAWDSRTKSWSVQAKKDSKTYRRGRFPNLSDAVAAAEELYDSLYPELMRRKENR